MNCPECHKHRDYNLCKVCNLCTNCCDCEETPLERWITVDGNQWRLRCGEIIAVIWLRSDNLTYRPEVRWSQFSKLIMPESKCLEEAKEACLKEIEKAKECIDDTA